MESHSQDDLRKSIKEVHNLQEKSKSKNFIRRSNYEFSKLNEMLQMFSAPYFGVYANDYTFFTPIKIFNKYNPTDSFLKTFPMNLKESIAIFRNRYNVDIEFFNLTLDGTFIMEKYKQSNYSHHLRVNTVLHPYIFYNVKNLRKNEEHKTICFTGLYTDDSIIDCSNYILDTHEEDGLRINPRSLIEETNKKEVIMHDSGFDSPAISPNNMAFLLDLKNNFSSFYILSALTYGNKIIRLMIAKVNIIMNPNINCLNMIINAFDSMNKSEYLYKKESATINIEDEYSNEEKSNSLYQEKITHEDIKENNLNIINQNEFQENQNKRSNFFLKKEKIMKYDINNTDNMIHKIQVENFLTDLFYFENTFKIIINFLRGFLSTKIWQFLLHKGINENLSKDMTFNDLILKLITICYSVIFYEENKLQFDDDLFDFQYENINYFNEISKKSNFINKINDYYPDYGLNKNKNELDNIKDEYILYKFFKFIEKIFKNPEIDMFGQKIFSEYINIARESKNLFFLKFIDFFFLFELKKFTSICNSYREFFNDCGCDIPLSKVPTVQNFHYNINENYEITEFEKKILEKHLNYLLIEIDKEKLLFPMFKDENKKSILNFLEEYCCSSSLNIIFEELKKELNQINSNKNDQNCIEEHMSDPGYDINILDEQGLNKRFECPFKQIFNEILDNSFNENLKDYEMNKYVQKLNLVLQNYLFYKTWERRGKILGIHDDFGRHSFLRTKSIDSLYHIKNHEKCEMLLEIITIFQGLEEE